jgi:putative transcriptional regulator
MKFPLSDLNKINNLPPKKGNLILAEPFMEDDYFGRSVVFMCEHNKKGSYGFILNNKLEIFLDDIVPEIELKKINIYYGGPVHSTNLFYLHQLGDLIEDSNQISDNIWTSGDFNQIIEFINEDIFKTDSDNLWKDILKKRGGKMKAIANFPLNPTDN